MLTLTSVQFGALDREARARFAREMVAHLAAFSPEIARLLAPPARLALVERALDEAAAHGFTRRGPARLYLEAVLQFGIAFDADPLLPWAGRILADPNHPDEMDRAFLLRDAIRAYLDRISGPGHARARAAFLRLQALLESPPDTASTPEIRARLIEAYPERALDAGPAALDALLARADAAAAAAGLSATRGQAVAAGLMLAMGVGAFDDPRHPWVSRAVARPAAADPAAREARLLSRARLYLGAALRRAGAAP